MDSAAAFQVVTTYRSSLERQLSEPSRLPSSRPVTDPHDLVAVAREPLTYVTRRIGHHEPGPVPFLLNQPIFSKDEYSIIAAIPLGATMAGLLSGQVYDALATGLATAVFTTALFARAARNAQREAVSQPGAIVVPYGSQRHSIEPEIIVNRIKGIARESFKLPHSPYQEAVGIHLAVDFARDVEDDFTPTRRAFAERLHAKTLGRGLAVARGSLPLEGNEDALAYTVILAQRPEIEARGHDYVMRYLHMPPSSASPKHL